MKVAVPLIASLGIGSVAAGGIYLHSLSEEQSASLRKMSVTLTVIEEDLRSTREEIRALEEERRNREPSAEAHAREAPGAPEATPTPAAGEEGPVAAPVPAALRGELKSYVAAALEEARVQRDEERKKGREEARQRLEARRRLVASLSEGPFDRFNLKVNSLAATLGMSDEQKQSYFDLSKGSWEKYQEARQKAAGAGGGQAPGGDPRRPPGRADRGQMRDLYESVQQDFSAAVQGILSPSQLEVYNGLPEPARSFRTLEMVSAPGEGDTTVAGRAPPGGPRGGGRAGRGR